MSSIDSSSKKSREWVADLKRDPDATRDIRATTAKILQLQSFWKDPRVSSVAAGRCCNEPGERIPANSRAESNDTLRFRRLESSDFDDLTFVRAAIPQIA